MLRGPWGVRGMHAQVRDTQGAVGVCEGCVCTGEGAQGAVGCKR